MNKNWQLFFQYTKNLPVHPLTKRGLKLVKNKNLAVDLGAGAFRDTHFICEHFDYVFGVDSNFFPPPNYFNFEYFHQTIESFVFPDNVDFINAMYSLPFLKPTNFVKVWRKLVDSLATNGVLCITLFGKKDDWKNKKAMTFHSLKEVQILLKGFHIKHLEEIKKDGELADGTPHRWHLFEIIATRDGP